MVCRPQVGGLGLFTLNTGREIRADTVSRLKLEGGRGGGGAGEGEEESRGVRRGGCMACIIFFFRGETDGGGGLQLVLRGKGLR